jgi:hypothetical protein
MEDAGRMRQHGDTDRDRAQTSVTHGDGVVDPYTVG